MITNHMVFILKLGEIRTLLPFVFTKYYQLKN
jgi:hypothetical protein